MPFDAIAWTERKKKKNFSRRKWHVRQLIFSGRMFDRNMIWMDEWMCDSETIDIIH